MKLNALIESPAEDALAFSDLISDHVTGESLTKCIKAYRELTSIGFEFRPEMMDQNPCFVNEDEHGDSIVIYISPSGKEFWIHADNGDDSFEWGGAGRLKIENFGDVKWKPAIDAIEQIYNQLSIVDSQFRGLNVRNKIRQTEED